jgi:serine/threonine-protein phosphatase PGAM5
MAARHLYLVRHGQYRIESGEGYDIDGSLTPIGREQASLTANALRTLPVNAVYCSPMRRAVETAEYIASVFDLVPRQVPELREVIPVIPPDLAGYFAEKMPDLTPEIVASQRQMADYAFDRFFQMPDQDSDQHEVLVCHGNIIQYFVCKALGAPGELWLNLDAFHCGITRCSIGTTGRRLLVSFNDIGHLPIRLRLSE